MNRRRLMQSGEKRTVALLHCDTPMKQGSNVTITDEAGVNWVKAYYRSINVVPGSKFGTGCYQMAYSQRIPDLITAAFDEIDCTKNGCTLEFWVKFYEMSENNDMIFTAGLNNSSGIYDSIIRIYNNINCIYCDVQYPQSSIIDFRPYDWSYINGVHEGSSWNHVAITIDRSGNVSFFINGNLVDTSRNIGPWKSITNVYVQSDKHTLYFDEIRVSRCVRYTDDFTPPTAPFEID